MTTEAYITGANAISETGEIVNIDGTGNRLAANFYGHKRLYIVAGVNKIEPTLERAIWRARNIAAPLRAAAWAWTRTLDRVLAQVLRLPQPAAPLPRPRHIDGAHDGHGEGRDRHHRRGAGRLSAWKGETALRGRFARIICLLLAAALLLPASGCASVFDKEYFSATDYEYARPTAGSDGAIPVTSYTTLRLAISALVTRHDESGTLDLSGYSGENISDDLASACNSVSRETALGSYAVDYISYEVNTIVGYTEAQIYVYYKRSQEEIDSIVNVATAAGLYTSIAGAVQAMSPGLVVLVSVTDVDEDEARAM